MNIVKRFFSKVNKTNSCWLWTASTNQDGYGHFFANGRLGRAHRWSWEYHNQASINKGAKVLHNCDNPLCVNPKHLFLGTQIDNIQDMVQKNRQAKGKTVYINRNSAKGERVTISKLTETKVLEIRSLYQTGHYTTRQLGKRFGVSGIYICYFNIQNLETHINGV